MAIHPHTHLVDGIPAEVVPVTNRGLAYADGVFETIRFRGERPVLWRSHYARLVLGCERLRLQIPPDLERQLLDQCKQLINANPLPACIIKIMVTRSGSGRGYRPASDAGVQIIHSLYPLPEYPAEYYHEGVDLWLCQTRLSLNPQFAGIKHLARLEQVLASLEFDDAKYQEGLMLDPDDRIIEGTRSNLFLELDGQLVTPATYHSGVTGVMRGFILDCQDQLGISTRIEEVTLAHLAEATAAFVCNSVFGIWPVRIVHQGDDGMINFSPGDMTRALQQHVFQTLGVGVSL